MTLYINFTKHCAFRFTFDISFHLHGNMPW